MTVIGRISSAVDRAPTHLSRSARDFWRSVARSYVLESHHVALLTLCCEALDRCVQARQILEREGLTVTDRFGAPRPHPCCAIERDSRLAVARLLKALDLDTTLPGPLGRPGGAA